MGNKQGKEPVRETAEPPKTPQQKAVVGGKSGASAATGINYNLQ